MSDISHSDVCDGPAKSFDDCDFCRAEMEKQDAYYGALYRSRGYSIGELRDAYSDPSDRSKLISLERENCQ